MDGVGKRKDHGYDSECCHHSVNILRKLSQAELDSQVKESQFWLAIFTSKNAFLRLIMRSSDLQKNQVTGLFSGWQLGLDAFSDKVASHHTGKHGAHPGIKIRNL